MVQRSSLQNCKAIGSNPIPHSKVMGVLQLWRVLHRTVNPVPRGKHLRFESVDTHHITRIGEMVSFVLWEHEAQVRFLHPRPKDVIIARVVQLVDTLDLGSRC